MSQQPSERTPASLLERVRRADDANSWSRFVDLYAPLLMTWIRRLGVPSEDRADVVQDVFATLTTELPRFRYDPARRFRGFLFRITRSRAADAARAAPRSGVVLPELAGKDTLQALIDADYEQHLSRLITRVVDTDFDPVTAAAFRRYVIDAVSPKDVAAELGITVASVYQAKTRVSRRLREELDGLLD